MPRDINQIELTGRDDGMPIWVIQHEAPGQPPDTWRVKAGFISKGGVTEWEEPPIDHPSLEAARASMPRYLVPALPSEGDPPDVVELWL